jgi:NDP-sugar pyrophosphorylase family protein
LPVAHRPLISYALSWLRDGGIQHASVCANRETQVLESRLHRHVPKGLDVSYHEDAMPRGAAGAVRDAAAASLADTFVVTDGTAIPNVDITDLLAAHHASRAVATVVLHVEQGRNGKPALQVPSGIYVFNREALENVPPRGFYDIKEKLIPELHRTNARVATFRVDHPCPRVLDASSYRAVNEWMVEQLLAIQTAPEGYTISGTCLIHRDATVAADAAFVGPILIGPGAQIGSGSVIVGPTSIGRDAVIGEGVLVSRSAIWRRCVLNDQAVADRCILADDSIVPAGTQAFREVIMTPAAYETPLYQSAIDLRENAALERLRKVSRLVFGSAAWSRSPAAQ